MAGAGAAAVPRRRAGRLSRWVPLAAAAAAKLKLLLVVGSALLSVAVYALGFGWTLAAAFVALLALHELGHVLAMRLKGFPASAPYFIPMLGAVIFAKRAPRDAGEDAFIGAGGPVTGVLASWLALALHALTGRQVFGALAVLGFLVHLFNLLPVSPLDGGRILAFLRWWVWIPAFVVLLFVFTYDVQAGTFGFPGPFGSIILMFVLMNLAGEWGAERRRRARQAAARAEADLSAALAGARAGSVAWGGGPEMAAAREPEPTAEAVPAFAAAAFGRARPAADRDPARGAPAVVAPGAGGAVGRAAALTVAARLACVGTWLGLAGATVAGFALALAGAPAMRLALTR